MMRLALASALAAVALLVAYVWLRSPPEGFTKTAEAIPIAAERVRPPRALPAQRYAPPEVHFPRAPRKLCGTELLAVDDDDEDTRVPAELRALATPSASAEELVAAFEDAELDRTEDIDFTARLELARDSRKATEQAVAENPPPSRPSADEDWTASDWYERFRKLDALGRLPEALHAAEEVYERDPSDEHAVMLAYALDGVGRTSEARRTFERALAKTQDPAGRAWLTMQIGFHCATHGDDACASRHAGTLATKGMTSEPLQVELHGFLQGIRGCMNGSYDEAVEGYSQSLDKTRDFVTLHNIAEVESCRGRPDSSRAYYREAMAHADEPNEHGTLLAGLGFSYLSEGDLIPAWILASSALTATGDDAHSTQPRKILALAALQMGDLGEARTQIHQSRKSAPSYDLVRDQCFPHPAQHASIRALVAEEDGDIAAAQRAWLEVARSGHPKLSHMARRALSEICPLSAGDAKE